MTRRPYDRVKRALDLAVAVPLLIASLPVQAGVAAAVRWKMGPPVLFRQLRPGKDGKLFELVKFRTMQPLEQGQSIADDGRRITRLGSVLRSTSLDELPTLWNVVRGEMSLVGPRPLLVEYLSRYSSRQARRHEVRPGVTGLAQVSGRNAIAWVDKLALDVHYVERRSLLLDAKILASTVRTVLSRRGVSSRGAATTTEFRGR